MPKCRRMCESDFAVGKVGLPTILTTCRWIFHGDDDSVVYLHQSEKFVELVRAKLPETKLRFDVAEGKDHAFDMDVSVWDEFPASKDAIAFLTKAWLE